MPWDVNVQDKIKEPFLVKFNQAQQSTTLAAATVIEDYSVEIADVTGFEVGQYLIIYSPVSNRFYTGYILSIVGTIIDVDTPLDSVFPIGAVVVGSITNMNVDGSTTPQVFGLRGVAVDDPLQQTFHITRIIFYCLTTSAVDLASFGNLTALTKGLVLRKRNGSYYNIFNVKSNGNIDGITLDWNAYESTNPNQGQDGFTARLTFNGDDKMGIVIDLTEGTDLEFIIQDALTDLTLLEVVAQGHILQQGED